MTVSRTLEQLIAEVRQRANLESSPYITDSEQSITDAELTNWINEGASELHEDLTLTPEHYKLTKSEHTIASASENSFNLPQDFFKIRLLEKEGSGGSYMTLDEFALNEHNQFGNDWDIVSQANKPRWCLLADYILIEPATQAPGNYRLWYAPEYVDLVEPDDVLEMPQHWHTYAVVYAAIQARIKKNTGSTDQLEMQLARLKARIKTASARRGQKRFVVNMRPTMKRVIR